LYFYIQPIQLLTKSSAMKSALIYITTIILSIAMLQACAPEEAEVERDQQAIQDSLDQAYEAEMEQMRQDSIAQALAEKARAEPEREMRRQSIEYSENGEFVVQIEAWRSQEKAQQQADQWINRGYERAFVVSSGNEDTGDVWYRVRIGQFNTRAMAKRFQTELNEDLSTVSWVSKTGQPVEEEAMQGN
jgi:cell division septation protein DedD